MYLRNLLLTVARRKEIAALKWADVDFEFRKLNIANKVDATRIIPLTLYLVQQLATLPQINNFVSASASKTGRMSDTRDTRASRAQALTRAAIDHLTIHGLRRLFA